MRDVVSEVILPAVSFLVGLFVLYMALFAMGTKNQLCRDFGTKIYGRELTWIECLYL